MEASPRTRHAPAYAAIVVDSGIRRRLELVGTRLTQAAESGDLDLMRHQAAHGRQEFEACRARWRALPERLRRELSFPSPNDHAVATVSRHAPVPGARIGRGRHGLVAGSASRLEGPTAISSNVMLLRPQVLLSKSKCVGPACGQFVGSKLWQRQQTCGHYEISRLVQCRSRTYGVGCTRRTSQCPETPRCTR
jgi:hypothetical protein